MQARKEYMADQLQDLLIPRQQVLLGEELGLGGFSTVYKGRWQGVDVAVKVLHVGLMSDYVQRSIQREAHVMYKVQAHPNVCNCLGLVMDPPSMCVWSRLC